MVNLANLITLGRLGSVPVIVWLLLEQRYVTAFWVFVLAGLSDGVDGILAKRFGMETALGRYLDPIADKALLVSIYVALGLQLLLPKWLVILVVSRDLLIVGAVLLASAVGRDVDIRPTLISKTNTALQIALISWVLAHFAFGLTEMADTITIVLIWAVAVTTAASWYRYLIIWLNHMAGMEHGK